MDFVLFIIAILVLAITGSETRIILVTILLGITLIVLAYVNIYWALFAIFVLVLLLILFDKTDIQNQRKKDINKIAIHPIPEKENCPKREQTKEEVGSNSIQSDLKLDFVNYIDLLKKLKPNDAEYGETLFHIGLLYEKLYQDYFRATGYLYLATVFDSHNQEYEDNYLRLCKLLEKNKDSDWVYYVTLIQSVDDIDVYANKLLLEKKQKKSVVPNNSQYKLKKYYVPKAKIVNNAESKFEGFNPESYLHSLGYKVGKSGLSRNGRRNLLKKAIESGCINKYDVIATLERNISMFHNRSNMQQSISDWTDDLYYVRNNF